VSALQSAEQPSLAPQELLAPYALPLQLLRLLELRLLLLAPYALLLPCVTPPPPPVQTSQQHHQQLQQP
jgi:hypothetical protein